MSGTWDKGIRLDTWRIWNLDTSRRLIPVWKRLGAVPAPNSGDMEEPCVGSRNAANLKVRLHHHDISEKAYLDFSSDVMWDMDKVMVIPPLLCAPQTQNDIAFLQSPLSSRPCLLCRRSDAIFPQPTPDAPPNSLQCRPSR